MAEVHHTTNYDTSGTGGSQNANQGLRISDNKGQVVTVTPKVSPVRGHVKTIKDVRPSGKHL